jgi:hypothetical protein
MPDVDERFSFLLSQTGTAAGDTLDLTLAEFAGLRVPTLPWEQGRKGILGADHIFVLESQINREGRLYVFECGHGRWLLPALWGSRPLLKRDHHFYCLPLPVDPDLPNGHFWCPDARLWGGGRWRLVVGGVPLKKDPLAVFQEEPSSWTAAKIRLRCEPGQTATGFPMGDIASVELEKRFDGFSALLFVSEAAEVRIRFDNLERPDILRGLEAGISDPVHDEFQGGRLAARVDKGKAMDLIERLWRERRLQSFAVEPAG